MIDFLFSFDRSVLPALKRGIRSVTPSESRYSVRSMTGDYGCLVVSEADWSGPIFENETHIAFVLGSPVFRTPLRGGGDATAKRIFETASSGRLVWSESLVGSFLYVAIDKSTKRFSLTTDINSFVPAYIHGQHKGENDSPLVVGSHADAIASALEKPPTFDAISVADFLVHQTVCYPHTMYRGIKQLPPASETLIHPKKPLSTSSYCSLEERGERLSFREAGDRLRTILQQNVQRICADSQFIGVLMSGGEDSRAVLSAIPDGRQVHALTVTDSHNKEARVAHRVCSAHGADWTFLARPKTHYLDHIATSVRLSESHNFFYHAHFNGFDHPFFRTRPILGGLMADSFWKGSHIHSRERLGWRFDIDHDHWCHVGSNGIHRLYDRALGHAVQERREAHNRSVGSFRRQSWAEWHSLLPATMNTDCTNYFVNRRLFRSVEPFADACLVRLSSLTPQPWKLNRRIFHSAMRPLFRKTMFIPRANGIYPYLGNVANQPLKVALSLVRDLKWRISRDFNIQFKNQGPWPSWKKVSNSRRFDELVELTKNGSTPGLSWPLGGSSANAASANLTCSDPILRLAAIQVAMVVSGQCWGDVVPNSCGNSEMDS